MRYAIKNASGGYYSICEIVGTKETIEKDANGNKSVHDRHLLKPLFDGHPKDCSRFETDQDATDMLTHAHLQDPAAFANCSVVPIEG